MHPSACQLIRFIILWESKRNWHGFAPLLGSFRKVNYTQWVVNMIYKNVCFPNLRKWVCLHVKYVCLSFCIYGQCICVCMHGTGVCAICVCANIHSFIHSAINFLFSTSHLFNGALSMCGPSMSPVLLNWSHCHYNEL